MRSGARRRATPVLLVAGIALAPVPAGAPPAGADARTPAAHRVAPDFSRTDLERREVHLGAYRGKVVLLNFWATWCEPCIAEVPRFAEWQRKYAGRLQVVGVSMDDEEAPVRTAYRKYRLNYPVVMGDEKLGELYGRVLGLPMTFLIDPDGKIRYQHEGAVDLGVLEREIRELLPRSQGSGGWPSPGRAVIREPGMAPAWASPPEEASGSASRRGCARTARASTGEGGPRV